MNSTTHTPLFGRQLLLALACAAFAIGPAFAQLAGSVTPDAKTLAKYDKNKNGKLDADELAAMQADEAKAAKAVGVTGAASAAAKEEVVQLSPFEVNAVDDKGYAAANSLAGTRLNSRLEDISASVSVVTPRI